MSKKKSRTVLSLSDKLKIVELIRKHTRKVGNGLVEYTEGWNDQKVAQEVGPHVNLVSHVKPIRREIVGNLFYKRINTFAPKEPAANSQLLARLVSLESRVTRLYAELGINS